MGYSLNQRFLSDGVTRAKDGTKVNEGTPVGGIRTEADIFRVLKVTWREPHLRRA
jgi:hypothetical protein